MMTVGLNWPKNCKVFSNFNHLLFSGVDIDKILTQRISSSSASSTPQNHPKRTMMGTAMLSAVASTSSPSLRSESNRSPPEPPPKQRNNLDSTAIDTRKIEVHESSSKDDLLAPIEDFTKPPEPVLFEPPPNAEATSSKDSAQRYKKGQLRLTKTLDGGWKLEEIEEQQRQQKQQEQRLLLQEQREQQAVGVPLYIHSIF